MIPTPPITHQSQQELRDLMQRAERKIAECCRYFEQIAGSRVRGLQVTRWPTGEYSAQIQLGPRVASAAAAVAAPSPCERE
jgi:hypothetical protein